MNTNTKHVGGDYVGDYKPRADQAFASTLIDEAFALRLKQNAQAIKAITSTGKTFEQALSELFGGAK